MTPWSPTAWLGSPKPPTRSRLSLAIALTPMSALGVLQAPADEPGSLPGIANASYGIGGSLGFAWAGTVVGAGTAASYHSGLWLCAAIGAVAVVASLILKPRPSVTTAGSGPAR